MGYYTNYQLSVTRGGRLVEDEELESIIQKLGEISLYVFDEIERNRVILWDAKWYDHDYDVAILSMLYPEYRFDLEGDGEEEDDIWESTYINGMAHYRNCGNDMFQTVPEFDPTLMKPCQLTKAKLKYLVNQLTSIVDDECAELNNIL